MHLAVFIYLLLEAQCLVMSEHVSRSAIEVNATEAFIYKFYPGLYNWTKEDLPRGIRYFVWVDSKYELPFWLGVRNERAERSLYLFGSAPPNVDFAEVLVTAVNQYSFESRFFQLHITVLKKNDYAKYAVQIMVRNMDIDDLYNTRVLSDLMGLFTSKFWRNAEGELYFTFIQTSELIPGERYPLKPDEKEGVMVNVGCVCNFSKTLYELEREIRPTKKNICPGYIKRMSVERHVRVRKFIFDWCHFKLITPDIMTTQWQRSSHLGSFEELYEPFLDEDIDLLPNKQEIAEEDDDRSIFRRLF